MQNINTDIISSIFFFKENKIQTHQLWHQFWYYQYKGNTDPPVLVLSLQSKYRLTSCDVISGTECELVVSLLKWQESGCSLALCNSWPPRFGLRDPHPSPISPMDKEVLFFSKNIKTLFRLLELNLTQVAPMDIEVLFWLKKKLFF